MKLGSIMGGIKKSFGSKFCMITSICICFLLSIVVYCAYKCVVFADINFNLTPSTTYAQTLPPLTHINENTNK